MHNTIWSQKTSFIIKNEHVIFDIKGISLMVTTMSLGQLHFTIQFFESMNIYTYRSEKFDSSNTKLTAALIELLKFMVDSHKTHISFPLVQKYQDMININIAMVFRGVTR